MFGDWPIYPYCIVQKIEKLKMKNFRNDKIKEGGKSEPKPPPKKKKNLKITNPRKHNKKTNTRTKNNTKHKPIKKFKKI